MNMTDVITGVTLTKACSIRPDGESEDKKVINLRVKFDGAQLGDVFAKALSSTVIAWQNGVGRKQYDAFKANQTVDVQFSAPASRAQIDPQQAMINLLRNMETDEEREAFIKKMLLESKA